MFSKMGSAVFFSGDTVPNQELSVLYGGATLNYEGQLSLYVRHMLRVNFCRKQLSDLQKIVA